MFRHRFDPSSLVAGLVFLRIAVLYLTAALTGHPVSYLWTMPAVLAAIAVIIVFRLAFRSRRT